MRVHFRRCREERSQRMSRHDARLYAEHNRPGSSRIASGRVSVPSFSMPWRALTIQKRVHKDGKPVTAMVDCQAMVYMQP